MSRHGGDAECRYRHEHLCLVLFVPAAYFGHLSTQVLLSRLLSLKDQQMLEHAHVYGQLIFSTGLMLFLQAVRLRTACVFAMITGVSLFAAMVNEAARFGGRSRTVGFAATYPLTMVIFIAFGVEAVTTVRVCRT